MTCPHCAQRPLVKIGQYVSSTCLNSYCQEAAYKACMARVKPKRKRPK